LQNSAGTWSFGTGGLILLNGASTGGYGYGILLSGGQIFGLTAQTGGSWYHWSSSWQACPTANSSTLVAGSGGCLQIGSGIWTFGTSTGTGGNQVMLTGQSTGGYANELELSGGELYALTSAGGWYEWQNSEWVASSNPNPGGIQAARTADLLNILGVAAHTADYASLNGATTADIVSDAQYLGITKWRDGLGSTSILQALYNVGISFVGLPWPTGNSSISVNLAPMEQVAAFGANALYAIEGPNEPGENGFTYNGMTTGGGASWAGVAAWQQAWYSAVKSTPSLSGVQVWSPSLVGEEFGNYGLQYLTIPAGPPHGELSPAGTVLADAENLHIYPMYQGHAQPVDQSADSFLTSLSGDFVTTYLNGYAGQTLAQAEGNPKGITEFGYAATGGTPNGFATDIPTQGKAIMNGFMNAYNEGFKLFSIYTFYEDAPDGGAGFGLLNGPSNPKASGTYLHNFTTPLKDTGTTAKTFIPGSLAFSFGGLPTSGKSLLFQKSNGNFELIIWNNVEDWNFAAGKPTTITPTNVTVTFSSIQAQVNVYNTIQGSTPISETSNTSSVVIGLADYPMVVEIVP
jgi:hypothetical protein